MDIAELLEVDNVFACVIALRKAMAENAIKPVYTSLQIKTSSIIMEMLKTNVSLHSKHKNRQFTFNNFNIKPQHQNKGNVSHSRVFSRAATSLLACLWHRGGDEDASRTRRPRPLPRH